MRPARPPLSPPGGRLPAVRWGLARTALLVAALLLLAALPARAAPVRARPFANAGGFVTGVSFTPDGGAFVSLQRGRILRISPQGHKRVVRHERVARNNEQGMLGVAVDSAFATNGFVYAFYTQRSPHRHRLVRYVWRRGKLGQRKVLIGSIRAESGFHAGGALAFDREQLYVTAGEATIEPLAQRPSSLNGKVLRVRRNGRGVASNPFRANRRVFSRGHRNSFGIAVDPKTHRVFESENGPDDCDEVNLIVRGGDYGWPRSRCGGFGIDPIWDSGRQGVVVPTGIVAYRGTRLGSLDGDLLVCRFATGALMKLELNRAQSRVVGARLFTARGGCGAAMAQAPDGTIAYATQSGRIYKITALP